MRMALGKLVTHGRNFAAMFQNRLHLPVENGIFRKKHLVYADIYQQVVQLTKPQAGYSYAHVINRRFVGKSRTIRGLDKLGGNARVAGSRFYDLIGGGVGVLYQILYLECDLWQDRQCEIVMLDGVKDLVEQSLVFPSIHGEIY